MATTTINVSAELDSLENVDTTGKSNKDILEWNATSQKWQVTQQSSGGGGNIEVSKFFFMYNQFNSLFYQDANIALTWSGNQRILLQMLTEPSGTTDLRSNFRLRTSTGTVQNTFIIEPSIFYQLNSVNVTPGEVADWTIGAENDPTYPLYKIQAFTTNPHVVIIVEKIN